MPTLFVPIEITYDTSNGTPVKDVIAALQSAEILIEDALAVLPSVMAGVDITLTSISVRRLSQESPLRELFIAAVFLASQQSLEAGVIYAAEKMTGAEVPPELHTLVTLAVVVVLFYGATIAKDAASGMVSEGPARRMLNALIDDISSKTNRSPEEVAMILAAKYAKPGPVRRLVSASLQFFRPSHREGATSIQIGGHYVPVEVVKDVPLVGEVDPDKALERFTPHVDVELEIHAQDRDKGSTGWAAVIAGITESRVRMKILPPVEPGEIWGRETIRGDVVLISRATAEGFEPAEIHLTRVRN